MSKSIIGGVVAVIAATLYFTVAMPFITANSLRSAVQQKDAQAVISKVDFDSVRSDLKADLNASIASQGDDIAMSLAGAFADGIIDNFVQPEALEAMVQNGTSLNEDSDVTTKLGFLKLVVTVDDGNSPVDIVFAPRGISWKVVGLNINFDQMG